MGLWIKHILASIREYAVRRGGALNEENPFIKAKMTASRWALIKKHDSVN